MPFAGVRKKLSSKQDFKNRGVEVKSVDSGKLGFLESIRGLAALFVVFAHILVTYYPSAQIGPTAGPVTSHILTRLFYGLPLGFMVSGSFAVTIFFVLSGFVLTYKFFQSGNPADLHRQAAKRYLRLAIPVFAIVMAAYFMIAQGAMKNALPTSMVVGHYDKGAIFGLQPDLGYAFHKATTGVLADRDARLNPVLWTMPHELYGSFIIFGLAALAGVMRRRIFLYGIATLILSGTYYMCFLLGMLLADLVANTNIIEYCRTKISAFYWYFALACIWVIACFPLPKAILPGSIYEHLLLPQANAIYIFRLWQFFAAFLLLAIIFIRPELQKILNHKALVWLGGLSFSIYLTHFLILHSLGDKLFIKYLGSQGFHRASLIAALATIIVTLLASMVWKRYVDDMSVKVSRAFANYVLKKPADATGKTRTKAQEASA